MHQFFDIRFGLEGTGQKALIEECAPGLDLVHLAQRFDNSRGAPAVGAVVQHQL